MTESDIKSVIARIPLIGSQGNGVDPDFQRRESRDEYVARRSAEQAYLFHCSPILSLIAVWCSAVKRVKTIDYSCTSYTHKHDVERNFNHYVSNGQMIAAAVFAGVPYRTIHDSINVRLALPKCGQRHRWLRDNIVVTPPLPASPSEWWRTINGTAGESLWRNVIATPGDTLARGVLADWLDENSMPHWANWMRLVGHGSLKRKTEY